MNCVYSCEVENDVVGTMNPVDGSVRRSQQQSQLEKRGILRIITVLYIYIGLRLQENTKEKFSERKCIGLT